MAYAWRIGPENIGFNLDEGEEILLLAGYLAAKEGLKLAEPWLAEFETMFLESGKGVGERTLRRLNEALRDAGRGQLALAPVPSGRTPYMQMRGAQKAAARLAILDDLRGYRAGMMLAEAREAIRRMPELPEHEADEQLAMFAEAASRAMGDRARAAERPDLSEAEVRTRAAALVRARHQAREDDVPAPPSNALPAPRTRDPGNRAAPPLVLPDDAEQPEVGDEALRWMWSDKLSEQPPPLPVRSAHAHPEPDDTVLDVLLRIESKLDALLRLERKLEEILRAGAAIEGISANGADGRRQAAPRRRAAE